MNDRSIRLGSGWLMLGVLFGGLLAIGYGYYAAVVQHYGPYAFAATLGVVAWFVALNGFVVVSPNDARVLQLFGTYVGTVDAVGFYYGNPLYTKTVVSKRVHTFETGVSETAERKDAAGNVLEGKSVHRQPTKVNDRDGTPIDIAAVVAWRVNDAARAVFEVGDYSQFVHMQSESALRDLASQYHYDSHDDQAHSLRGHTGEVAEQLQREVQKRVDRAGVEIVEARISYLAYAPEIASAMLQRQQAQAVIAARRTIVEGAVGMVEMALEQLAQKNLVAFDDDRKAAMVSNLLVVLCGDRNPQPIVNAGSIYQ